MKLASEYVIVLRKMLRRERWRKLLFPMCGGFLFVTLLYQNYDQSEENRPKSSMFKGHRDEENPPLLSSSPIFKEYRDEGLLFWKPASPVLSKPGNPGDMGAPVKVPSHRSQEASEKFSKHQLNLVASDLVSINRALPDIRPPSCQGRKLPEKLPSVSVVVVYHNEPDSTLLRTVSSVVNRSPHNLLSQVILVDDNSEPNSSFKLKIRQISPKVEIVSLPQREGLIRARLSGASAATGQVLVFLDSHMEVTQGWLEPLLSQVAMDRTTVAVPVIDIIDKDNFSYRVHGEGRQRSGFDWKLRQVEISSHPLARGESPAEPFPTPTIIGCAFAVDREFFWQVGAYDRGMDIWGGENVEQSIRTWLCGGSLLVNPCSHVGHVYRDSSPHSFPGGFTAKMTTITANIGRWAAVWLEDLYSFYLAVNPLARTVSLGDLSSRISLKKELRCRDMRWYLRNVYPDAPLPWGQHRYVGQVKAVDSSQCLDAMEASTTGVGLRMCHGLGGLQTWMLTKSGQIQSSVYCLEASSFPPSVLVSLCSASPNQTWTLIPDHPSSSILASQSLQHASSSILASQSLQHASSSILAPQSLQHAASGLCLTHSLGHSASPRSMLGYLTAIATSRKIDRPTLQECQGGNNQMWDLGTPTNWTSGP